LHLPFEHCQSATHFAKLVIALALTLKDRPLLCFLPSQIFVLSSRRPWVTRTIPIIERTCSLGTSCLYAHQNRQHRRAAHRTTPSLFASRRTSPSAFRRIHDDRTPPVDAAAAPARADFLQLANNDFVSNTIIGPACSERPLRLGSRPAEQF
jgi:hypothetical protein